MDTPYTQKQYEQPVKKAIVVKAKKSNAIIIPVASFPHHLCLVYKMAQCQLHFYTDWRFVYVWQQHCCMHWKGKKSSDWQSVIWRNGRERGATHPERDPGLHYAPTDFLDCLLHKWFNPFITSTLFFKHFGLSVRRYIQLSQPNAQL